MWYVYYASVVFKSRTSEQSRIIYLLYYKELDERFKLLIYNLTAGIDYMERTFIPAIEQTSD